MSVSQTCNVTARSHPLLSARALSGGRVTVGVVLAAAHLLAVRAVAAERTALLALGAVEARRTVAVTRHVIAAAVVVADAAATTVEAKLTLRTR